MSDEKPKALVVKLITGEIHSADEKGKAVIFKVNNLLREGVHFAREELEAFVKRGIAKIHDPAAESAARAAAAAAGSGANGVVSVTKTDAKTSKTSVSTGT